MAIRKMRRSSGNVFRDLGFSAAEAENLRIRSELMARLARVIDDRDLAQVEAARVRKCVALLIDAQLQRPVMPRVAEHAS